MRFLVLNIIVFMSFGCFTTKIYNPAPSYFENSEYSSIGSWTSAKCEMIVLSNHRSCYECYKTVEQSEVPFITCPSKTGYIIWR
jgi:hypothetical protein